MKPESASPDFTVVQDNRPVIDIRELPLEIKQMAIDSKGKPFRVIATEEWLRTGAAPA